MKYTVVNLDGRYAYRDRFKYYLGFSTTMTRQQGPIAFNDAVCWFTERYGWSAEIKQWHHISRWTGNQLAGIPVASGILAEPSAHCNPHWSWSNGYQDLRVYVASEQELAFWQLAYPVDQKRQ